MAQTDDDPKLDWIDLTTRLAGALGFNKVRTRWKLMAWRDSWKSGKHQARVAVERVNYQHKICPHCGTVQDRALKTCSNCGQSLSPRFFEILHRLGLVSPHFLSVSSLLTLAIGLCYLRTVMENGWNPLDIDPDVLVAFGGNFTPAIRAGEWWRLSTYIFLHAGLWHILFNLFALQQIGPQLEEVFGKGRMLFFFMVTGIVAGLGSELWGLYGVGIGASGALMGLIGLAAGWGHREGTSMGRIIRDQMVKWGVYTMVFGFFIHADNVAHAVGFISGALLGLVSRPRWERPRVALDGFLSLVGAVLAIGTVWLVLFPPHG
jgi:membrane associated rhomboid family serine protease